MIYVYHWWKITNVQMKIVCIYVNNFRSLYSILQTLNLYKLSSAYIFITRYIYITKTFVIIAINLKA
jgi:hypothetical protein